MLQQLCTLKPLIPMFLEAAWDNLVRQPELIIRAWDRVVGAGVFTEELGKAAVRLAAANQLFPAAGDGPIEEEEEPAPSAQDSDGDDALEKLVVALEAVQNDPNLVDDIPLAPAELSNAERLAAVGIREASVILPPTRGRGRGGTGG